MASPGDGVGEFSDFAGGGLQVGAPLRVVVQRRGDGRQPRQRPAGGLLATVRGGEAEAPVEDGGGVARIGETPPAVLAVGDRALEQLDRVGAVDGAQGEMGAQRGVGGEVTQVQEGSVGGGVDGR